MIFVTVGTDTQQFNRLLEELDSLIENKKIKEKVIAQIGNSTYLPKQYKYFNFLDSRKFFRLINQADLVISHAGIGSLMTIKEHNKPLVVVPRLKKFDEHTDDHQIQIAKELDKQKKVVSVFDIKDLFSAIKRARNMKIKTLKTTKISKIVSDYLSQLEMNPK